MNLEKLLTCDPIFSSPTRRKSHKKRKTKHKRGRQGFQGNHGNQGFLGLQGFQGIFGSQGLQGNQGSVGVQGISGAAAAMGFQGNQGFFGFQGFVGFQGNQGFVGLQGFQGNQGFIGFQGNQGFLGLQGFQGIDAATVASTNFLTRYIGLNNQPINTTDTPIQFDQSAYNNGWIVNGGGSSYTATATGLYQISYDLLYSVETTQTAFTITSSVYQNGSSVTWFIAQEAMNNPVPLQSLLSKTALLSVTVGDIIAVEINIQPVTPTTATVLSSSTIAIIRIT